MATLGLGIVDVLYVTNSISRTISQTQFVVGLSNGDINVVSCDSEDKLSKTQTYFAVHNKAASTAVCVVNNEIFSGSDTGTIVRISPTRKTKAISTLSTVYFML